MLQELKESGRELHIVSSNTLENVQTVLGNSFSLFSQILTSTTSPSKRESLYTLVTSLRKSTPKRVSPVYVGDTITDAKIAHSDEIRIPFVGVGYGWEITKLMSPSTSAPVVHTVESLSRILLV